jgi:hypothetical protein
LLQKKLISPATATNSFWTDLQNSPKGKVSNQLMVVLFIFTMHFEDGNLFDSSYEDVNTWVHLMNRAAKRIPTFPFQAGKKTV